MQRLLTALLLGGVHLSAAADLPSISECREKLRISMANADEKNPLRSYIPMHGMAGRLALDRISAKGVPATPQSAASALGLLRSGCLSIEEKISMIRILYDLYNREGTTGANNDIAVELKALAENPENEIAGNAAVSYAGLEYRPDADHVLRQAFKNGALDVDSYFRVLALLVTSAPPEKQKEIVAEMRASPNWLASYILAAALNNDTAPLLKSSEDMEELLRATEPEFPKGFGHYGGTDAIRYATWLRASAIIESQKTGRDVDDIIIAELNGPGMDPRKVMAYLSSSEAMPLLADAAPDSQVQRLAAIARQHASRNPTNSEMTDTARLIESRMKNRPPTLP